MWFLMLTAYGRTHRNHQSTNDFPWKEHVPFRESFSSRSLVLWWLRCWNINPPLDNHGSLESLKGTCSFQGFFQKVVPWLSSGGLIFPNAIWTPITIKNPYSMGIPERNMFLSGMLFFTVIGVQMALENAPKNHVDTSKCPHNPQLISWGLFLLGLLVSTWFLGAFMKTVRPKQLEFR